MQALVEVENLHTRNAQRWVRLDAVQLIDFPELTLEYLRDLTIGVYRIKLAPSYVQDKLQRDAEEEFQIEMLRAANRTPERGLLRVRVYSRFHDRTTHQLWIAYVPNGDLDDEQEDQNEELVLGYYCTCQSGSRIVGTCAHITSVLWFLGYARHEENVHYPSTRMIETIYDARNHPQNP